MCQDDPDFAASIIRIETNNGEQEVSVIDKARLEALFKKIKDMPLGYDCSDEGCDARAQKIAQFLDQNKIQSAKAIVTTQSSTTLRPEGIAPDRGWNFHIAPVVYIRQGGRKLVPYVIDPALFPDGAVDMNTWLERSRGRTSADRVEHYLATKYTFNEGHGRRASPANYRDEDNISAESKIQICNAHKAAANNATGLAANPTGHPAGNPPALVPTAR